uniref:Uncharacterized protein n=1 Tax=Siphoviridae sp. ctGMq5 TaxID=2826220 RepID=A0A8S5NNK0_9CAUD|nr:MAG TPA: hypothetical protein [Siphoviridae sp. ctGMq5]
MVRSKPLSSSALARAFSNAVFCASSSCTLLSIVSDTMPRSIVFIRFLMPDSTSAILFFNPFTFSPVKFDFA